MLTEIISADNKKAIAGYVVRGGPCQHERESTRGPQSYNILYLDDQNQSKKAETKKMLVGVCDDEQPYPNYCVVSMDDHKVGTVLAIAYGDVLSIPKKAFDQDTQRYVQPWHNNTCIVLVPKKLSPAEIGDMCAFKLNEDGVEGHHGCAQYILPTSLKEAANVKFIPVGPYPRGDTEVPVDATFVAPNNCTRTENRRHYETSYIAVATREIKAGDVLLVHVQLDNIHAIKSWSIDMSLYSVENTFTEDPFDGSALRQVSVLSRNLVPLQNTQKFGVDARLLIRDDGASDPDTPLPETFKMRQLIRRGNESQVGAFELPKDEWLDQQQSGAAADMAQQSYDQRMLMAHSTFTTAAKSRPAPSPAAAKAAAAALARAAAVPVKAAAAPAVKAPSPVLIDSDEETPAPPRPLAGPRTPSPELRPASKKARVVQESRTPSPDLNVAASKANPLPRELASKAGMKQKLAAMAEATAKALAGKKERSYSSASASSSSRSPSPLPQKPAGRAKAKAVAVGAPNSWRAAGSAPAMPPMAKGRGRPAGKGRGKP